MDSTTYFAQFWGILMIVMPLGLLVRPRHFKAMMDGVKDGSMMPVYGIIALLMGLYTVLSHNLWTGGMELVITIIGWLALIKGIVYFVFPGVVQNAAGMYENKSTRTFLLVIALLIGLWLSYIGFLA